MRNATSRLSPVLNFVYSTILGKVKKSAVL